jgi:ABC-type sulfate transport system permease component
VCPVVLKVKSQRKSRKSRTKPIKIQFFFVILLVLFVIVLILFLNLLLKQQSTQLPALKAVISHKKI